MEEITAHVRALQLGNATSKTEAAEALADFADTVEDATLIAEAGGVPPLVHLLRVGSAEVKSAAAMALANVTLDANNQVLVVEAGGIAPLVKVLRDGGPFADLQAAGALFCLARNNDANAVAIAVAVGFDALVELARGGRVTVNNRSVMRNAGVPAKRKAALVVPKLLRDRVPEFKSAPGDIKAAIASFL